ncbi:protein of unknown function [Cyanobium sp. NIES-981]|nr:protein of unknown function [Cyanobium sp. NIES-981]
MLNTYPSLQGLDLSEMGLIMHRHPHSFMEAN